jgi:CRISPR-associated protein Csb1
LVGFPPFLQTAGRVTVEKESHVDYTIDLLNDAVDQHAAIRRVRRLQPAGGPGDKVFPPTYPGDGRNPQPVHVFENRRVDGETVECVLLDSVQSQANRLEEALLAAMQAGRFAMPVIGVSFADTPVADIGMITTLDAPHRVFDAILRDSQFGKVPFRKSPYGERLQRATMRFATALFETSPAALVFGAWNSTSEGGGLGAKFPRCLVSEIIGIGADGGKRTGSRIDPLGIRAQVKVYKQGSEWSTDEAEAQSFGQGGPRDGRKAQALKPLRPSEINHGNIAPTIQSLGVTMDYAVHTVVITLAGLRRLSFPSDGHGSSIPGRDQAARAALAALAVVAVTEQDRSGYALRSRCDLVPEPAHDTGFELVKSSGATEPLLVDANRAIAVLQEAVEQAERAGLSWPTEPILLTPQPRLVELVRRSRELALAGDMSPEAEV